MEEEDVGAEFADFKLLFEKAAGETRLSPPGL